MSELLFEYKVRYRYKTGYKEFSFYATTEIEEFLNRNNIEYVRNMTDTVESRLFKEIERLNNIINELEKWLEERIEKHTEDYLDWKYDRNVYLAGSEKLQNVFDKLQELKGSDKE